MRYKLINKKTKEEHICDKITIKEFDYYINDDVFYEGEYFIHISSKKILNSLNNHPSTNNKKILATNNKDLKLPIVIDEIEQIANNNSKKYKVKVTAKNAFIEGYNKACSSYPYNEEDIIGFTEWCAVNYCPSSVYGSVKYWQKGHYQNKEYFYSTKELLDIWKDEKINIVYYERQNT